MTPTSITACSDKSFLIHKPIKAFDKSLFVIKHRPFGESSWRVTKQILIVKICPLLDLLHKEKINIYLKSRLIPMKSSNLKPTGCSFKVKIRVD